MSHEHHHHHHHGDEESGTFGMALGFRTVEDEGKLYLAEAEVAPYIDEPGELGVTLVFHPLEGIDPTDSSPDVDWPAWPVDIDDDLERATGDSVQAQFQAILRQLHRLSNEQLVEYLRVAREEAEG